MNKQYMIIMGILVLAIVGVVVYKGMGKSNAYTSPDAGISVSTGASNQMPSPTVDLNLPDANVKSFTVDGSNYQFSPSVVRVQTGDKVKITFVDNDGMHNLAIDGYNVKTPVIQSGSSASVEFTADKAGTFRYFCSVDSHADKGMTGSLIVE